MKTIKEKSFFLDCWDRYRSDAAMAENEFLSAQTARKTLTPLMKQYWEIKSQHLDKILLFRMGDFYEMFDEDAKKAAPVLNIALTQRNKKSVDDTAMCGVPYHSIAGPINKLLANQFKVAVCEQVEDPKESKGIVQRAVTRILTPGMVYDPNTLEESKSHYIASVDKSSLSFFDGSTGESFYYLINEETEIIEALQMLVPVELVVQNDAEKSKWISFCETKKIVLSVYKNEKPFQLKEIQIPESLSRLLSYGESLVGSEFSSVLKIPYQRNLKAQIFLSENVQKHLEIFQNNKGESSPTFFSCINRALTSGGRRLLRSWILAPLIEERLILQRQEQVFFWKSRFVEMKSLRALLAQVGDLERRFVKITAAQVNGRDILSLYQSLKSSREVIQNVLKIKQQETSVSLRDQFLELDHLIHEIAETLVDEPPISIKQGHLIRKGFRADLDEYIVLTTDAHQILQEMETREKAATGISSLKIRFNNVFGYYIEVTNTHKDKAPAHYKRKQTLATAERYYTEELLELEKKILSAQTKRFDLEFEIFENLRKKILSMSSLIQQLSDQVSLVDVELGLAWLSKEENYVRPQISKHLELNGSRHVVLDQTLKGKFISNHLVMTNERVLLITGPNMAGKSTVMRQVGLSAILHQLGSDVPASEAKLPLFDQIYTRIGASDQLSEGLSTFMVEMKETGELLKNATQNSLVILDEIGRGTATFDGMSLAEAILEYLVEKKGSLTFFATHYHELTVLSEKYSQVRNCHMSVREHRGELSFQYQLKPGPALKSYGIAVAKLAGLPTEVLQAAQMRLKALEEKANEALGIKSLDKAPKIQEQFSFEDWEKKEEENFLRNEKNEKLMSFVREISEFPLEAKTPLETMVYFAEIQSRAKSI